MPFLLPHSLPAALLTALLAAVGHGQEPTHSAERHAVEPAANSQAPAKEDVRLEQVKAMSCLRVLEYLTMPPKPDKERRKDKEKADDKQQLPPPEPAPSGKPATPPKPPLPPIVVGIVGDDPTAKVLAEAVVGQHVGEAELKALTVSLSDALAGLGNSRIDLLYLAQPIDLPTATRIIAACSRQPTVLVCDLPGFAAAGGDFQLFVETTTVKSGKSRKTEAHVKLEINQAAIQGKGIRASSQLLKLSSKGPVR